MLQHSFLMYFVAFVAAVFVLRLARFTFTFGMQMIEDSITGIFSSCDTGIRSFFLKVDYIVNDWTLFKIHTFKVRWHYIAAFLYVITR